MIRINNVLLNKERLKILNFVKPKLTLLPNDDAGRSYPGLQTTSDLHTKKEMQTLLKVLKKKLNYNEVLDCWANYTDGSFINWHKHNIKTDSKKEAVVYYLLNPDNLGTMFRDMTIPNYEKIYYTKAKQNSAIKFNASEVHSVPNSFKKINRISIALNVI